MTHFLILFAMAGEQHKTFISLLGTKKVVDLLSLQAGSFLKIKLLSTNQRGQLKI